MHRRTFLSRIAAATAFGLSEWSSLKTWAQLNHVPMRTITRGPEFHWFGYYDKLEFDPTSRYVLGQRVGFQGRTPAPDDVIHIGMVDLEDGDRWTDLGESRAWCWQQGCMLQWLPGSKTEVIWNDREGDHFVSHILDVKSGKKRTLPHPIYALSPDARWAIANDFSRIHDTRPGYGYAGIPDKYANVLAPKESGVWKIDLKTGSQKLICSIAEVDAVQDGISVRKNVKQRLEHLLVAPDGSRICFLHRWEGAKGQDSFETRLMTAAPDGSNLYALDPYGKTSHFIWENPKSILAWSWHPSAGDKFYIYEDHTRNVKVIGEGVMTVNGHCTYLPGNQWILNDTYPDAQGLQHPFLYRVSTGKRYPLADLSSPKQFRGEFRCDTHPRFSPDGKKVVVDSPHAGEGRQLYLLDISSLVRSQ